MSILARHRERTKYQTGADEIVVVRECLRAEQKRREVLAKGRRRGAGIRPARPVRAEGIAAGRVGIRNIILAELPDIGSPLEHVPPLHLRYRAEDLVHVMRASLVDDRLKRQTVALLGPEEIYLSEAVRRVAEVVGKRPLLFPLPVSFHYLFAHFFELIMKIPLTSLAQVRILAEGVVTPGSPVEPVPYDLVPRRRFSAEQIRNGLPEPGAFGIRDLRCRA